VVLLVGCRGEDGSAGRDPVYPVSGKVTYKGQPVAGADITFMCEESSRSAFGRTDEQGRYRLSTFGANDGAVAGKHAVAVMKVAATVTSQEKVPDTFSPDYEPPTLLTDSTPPPPAKGEIPAKYSSTATSGLIVVVNPDSPNTIDLDLTD